MSEEYKLSNVTCGLDDTNYAICLEGEHLGYNKKALQEVADKANSHDKLTQQVAELRAALSECRKYIECDTNNRLKPHNPAYLVKLSDKALEENK